MKNIENDFFDNQNNTSAVSLTTRKHREIFKRTFHLVKEQKQLSREVICAVALRDVDVVMSLMKLRTILEILQESDQLAQEKRSHAVTSVSKNAKFVENSKSSRKSNSWHIKNKILHYNEKYYISSEQLRRELLRQNSDYSQAEHFEYDKILELLRRKYYWSTMSTDVRDYIDFCTKCVQAKFTEHKSYELLQSLSVLSNSRKD
jgi:hypothetical protein